MSNTISIITVTHNDFDNLKKTIQNVLNLEFSKFEHIVIDGGSGKKTVNFLKKCDSLYKEKKIDFKWISEPDRGIYYAMNKGIHLSNGIWLNFMNAGDTFASKSVINEILPHLNNSQTLIYGNKIMNNKIIKSLHLKYLEIGIIMACHQSMFFNKELLNGELFYSTQYKIYADYELVNRIYKKNPLLLSHINIEISIYQGGGVSESKSYQKRKDKFKIVYKTYGVFGIFKAYTSKFFPKLIDY